MPRKPTDDAQIKLRISRHLRAKLDIEAKQHRISLNSEVTRRLDASLTAKSHGDIAAITQDLREIATELEIAWARLEATREVLVLGDLITTAIIDHGERFEWVEQLAWPAKQWRRLRATVDQPLSWARHPGESKP